MKSLQLVASILQLGVLPTCLAKCYYPGGKEAIEDLPCDPDAEVSACCAGTADLGFSCLSNKLCVSPKGRFARGSCTDPTWMSPDCPRYCMSEQGRGWDLVSCSNFTHLETSFCCDGMPNCCDSGVGRLEIDASQAIYEWAVYDTTKDAYIVKTPLRTSTPSATSTASSSTTDSDTSSGTSTTKTAESSEGTSGPSPSTTGTRAATETGAQGQPSTEQSSGLSTGAQVGIGVGAAVGALLIAAVAYLWWKLRKTQAAVAATAATQHGWHEAYPPAPSYYARDPATKYELQGERETHELQGQSYYPQGDGGSTEMSTHASYSAVESPVTTHRAPAR